MTTTRPFSIIAGISALLLVSACDSQDATPVTADEPTAEPALTSGEPQATALPPRTPAADDATVFFIAPADGDTVGNPVQIEFGLDGMNVVAAGVHEAHSGHHHLLVDTDPPDMGLPIPADENHIHFGDASTSTELTLEPGQHTLQLLLGDHLHIPHEPPIISDPITITVE